MIIKKFDMSRVHCQFFKNVFRFLFLDKNSMRMRNVKWSLWVSPVLLTCFDVPVCLRVVSCKKKEPQQTYATLEEYVPFSQRLLQESTRKQRVECMYLYQMKNDNDKTIFISMIRNVSDSYERKQFARIYSHFKTYIQ